MIRSGMARFHDDLAPMLRPIDSVERHPHNYNNGDVDAVAESIEVNGMYRPIFVQRETGYIIAGNHTWEACKRLGATQVPVVYLDVSDEQAIRVMIADNRTAALAMPDHGQLVDLLDMLNDSEKGMVGTGYNDHDLDVLHHLADIPLETDEFAQWPTLQFKVPPHVKRAFERITAGCEGEREQFEVLLRLAGWDGK